jgi:hypothetical protein
VVVPCSSSFDVILWVSCVEESKTFDNKANGPVIGRFCTLRLWLLMHLTNGCYLNTILPSLQKRDSTSLQAECAWPVLFRWQAALYNTNARRNRPDHGVCHAWDRCRPSKPGKNCTGHMPSACSELVLYTNLPMKEEGPRTLSMIYPYLQDRTGSFWSHSKR